MPLVLKVRGEKGEWHQIGMLRPGDLPGSISDNRPERRDLYMFTCSEDDSRAEILKAKAGIDAEYDTVREIINLNGFDTVKTLRKGEAHELEITRANGGKAMLRFVYE